MSAQDQKTADARDKIFDPARIAKRKNFTVKGDKVHRAAANPAACDASTKKRTCPLVRSIKRQKVTKVQSSEKIMSSITTANVPLRKASLPALNTS